MSTINILRPNSGEPLEDLETVRLIYTFKQNYKGGTYAIHLTMEDLNQLIKEVKNLDDNGIVGNGVTFYLGQYPENYPLITNQGNADYSELNTIVAVPTLGESLSGAYEDFMSPTTVIICREQIDDGNKIDNKVSALDHFRLCPPHTNCDISNIIWKNL